MNIAILDMYDGRANEGMRCIKMLCGQFLSQDGIEGHYDIFDVRQKTEFPNIENYDIFISTGGPGNPLPEGHAWEAKYNHFIDQIFAHNQASDEKKYFKPFQAYLLQQNYAYTRTIYAINGEPRDGLGTGFVSYVCSNKGQTVAQQGGLLPLTQKTWVKSIEIKKNLN